MPEKFVNKKKFITFIDHWTHYKSRFDFRYLPDEICPLI